MSTEFTSRDEREFATSRIGYLFRKYSTPTVMGLLLIALLAIVDAAFIGNCIGAEAIAALNIVLPIYKLNSAIALIIGIGSMTVISTSLGERNYIRANNSLRTSIISLTTISLILTIILMVFRHDILYFMGAEDPIVMRMALDYYNWLVPFFPFLGIVFIGDFTLKAQGKPYYATLILGLVVTMNIFLDYIFVAKLGWGMQGAGIATSTAYVSGSLLVIYKLQQRNNTVSVRKGHFNLRLLKRMSYNGSSEGVADLSSGFAMFLFNKTMIEHFGTDGVAALTAINYIQFIGITIFLGISDGIVPVISYNYGARNRPRINSMMRYAFITNLAIGLGFLLVIHLFGRELTGLLFDNSTVKPSILEMSYTGAKIWALAFIFNGTNILISAYFTAISKPGQSILIAAIRGLIVLSGCILLIPDFFGKEYIWYAVPVTEFITLLIAVTLFFRSNGIRLFSGWFLPPSFRKRY